MCFSRILVFFIVTFFPSLFISCGKKLQRKDSLQRQCSFSGEKELLQQRHTHAKEIQAKLFDIPVPIGFQYVTDEKTVHAHLVVYAGMLPLDKVRFFYLQEMERLAWKIEEVSAIQEAFLWCTKMNKQCGVSIRVDQVKTYIYLFVKIKNFDSKRQAWFD